VRVQCHEPGRLRAVEADLADLDVLNEGGRQTPAGVRRVNGIKPCGRWRVMFYNSMRDSVRTRPPRDPDVPQPSKNGLAILPTRIMSTTVLSKIAAEREPYCYLECH
jgi:hypothetical protein